MTLKNTSRRSTGTLLLTAVVLCLNAAACQVPDAPGQAIPDPSEPWNWSEEDVRTAVNRVRAGRDLNPESWPGGARVAVLLSFDVDNETVQGLRTGTISIGPCRRANTARASRYPAWCACSTERTFRPPSSSRLGVSSSPRNRPT